MGRSSIRLLISISVYAFALSFMWNTLHPLIMPYLIDQMQPELKNTFLGLISAAGLVVATIIQPLFGGISDRSRSRWGRRRPFIVAGTLGDVVCLALISLASGYWFLFMSYCLLQFSSNVAHGPYQGFIPDQVPDDQKGLASGAKNLVELLALVIGSLIIGALVGQKQVFVALMLIAAVLVVAMVITTLFVRENTAPVAPAPPSVPRLDLAALSAALRRHSTFAWYVLSRFLILTGLAAVRTFAQNYIKDVLHADNPPALAGQLMTILGLAVLVVVLPAGFFADKAGKKRLNLIAALIGALGTALMLTIHSYNDLLLYGSIVGVAIGIFLSANWALAMDLIPAGEAALFLGLTNLATAGSGAAAGLLGPVIDVVNEIAPGQGYQALFAAAALMWLAGGLILVRMPAKR